MDLYASTDFYPITHHPQEVFMASWIGTGGSNPGDVATNGSIGAGTSSPARKLEASDSAYQVARVSSSHTYGACLEINPTATGGKMWTLQGTANGASQGAGKLVFYANGDTRMTIDSTYGNLVAGGNVQATGGGYTGGHLVLGNYHIWVDTSGRLKIKNGLPVSDGEGVVVGTQT